MNSKNQNYVEEQDYVEEQNLIFVDCIVEKPFENHNLPGKIATGIAFPKNGQNPHITLLLEHDDGTILGSFLDHDGGLKLMSALLRALKLCDQFESPFPDGALN